MTRYQTLLQLIDVFKPQTICEIGTWNGDNAIRMIRQAEQYHTHVDYFGFDLFEEATNETDKEEFNVKPHNRIDDIEAKIRENCPNAYIELVKGNTRETLKEITVDFVFLDGGHSVETIAGDYDAVRHSNVIVFDDFYVPDNHGRMPDIKEMGCNQLMEELPHGIIEARDPVVDGGYINLAVVFGK